MLRLRAFFALAAMLAGSGCGYVHFGRRPDPATPAGDAALAAAYTDLRTEHKILRQELLLARREGDALRTALDRNAGGADLAARLQETARELATLRASYARLQSERGAPFPAGSAAAAMAKAALEEKLAATLRDFTTLQEENNRLRADVARTREENVRLASDLKSAAANHAQAQAALAQVNAELLAQKDARARAEQQAEAARAQLAAVVARAAAGRLSLADTRETAARSAVTLTASGAAAELRTGPERLATPGATATPRAPRVHVVKTGDTLESLARKYYGAADQWPRLHAANVAQLAGGRPLAAGMELTIPDE